MKTALTDAQRAEPGLRVAEAQLRACVHCGFCLSACPTYGLVGDERDSPRGRIVLMMDLLERGTASPAVVHHLDRCLSCLSCQTACPSGVSYMHLVDHARERVEAARPLRERVVRGALAAVIPRPGLLAALLRLVPLGRWAARWLPARLRAGVELAPRRSARRFRPEGLGVGPPGPRGARPQVALLVGCAQSVLDAPAHEAAVRVLRRAGAEVVVVPGLGCCGAVELHLGRGEGARARARANVRALLPHLDALDAVVSTAAGCGTACKDYGHLLADDPLAGEAARVAGLARDVLEVVEALGSPASVRPPATPRVAYHAPCSLQHGQRIREGPPALLRAAGYTVVEPADAHLCCGSAGTYNLLQPELAGALGDAKARALDALRPDVIAAGNVGCALQIGARTGVPVRHPIELLDDVTRE